MNLLILIIIQVVTIIYVEYISTSIGHSFVSFNIFVNQPSQACMWRLSLKMLMFTRSGLDQDQAHRG